MNKSRLITIWLACLMSAVFCEYRTLGQQPSPPMTIEQEFFDAIKKGKSEKVRELLNVKPELVNASTKNGTTAVLYAVFANHKEIADVLLAGGREANIFEAAATGRLDRLRQLLKQDSQLVKTFSADGWTALHLNWGNPQVAQLLLDSGSDLEAVSKNRFMATPLQSAVAVKWTAVARFFIDRGANVNCRGDGGFRPLHEAAGSGQLEIAKLLLEHGAKTDAKTDADKTPLDIAVKFKQEELARLLREWKPTL